MIEVIEIGTYTGIKAGEIQMYMVSHDGGKDYCGNIVPPAVVYCAEVDYGQDLFMWPDWLQFAHAVNSIAGSTVLDVKVDPAEEAGLVVATGSECPDCGCRVIDVLVWVGEDHEDVVFCNVCETMYIPGEP